MRGCGAGKRAEEPKKAAEETSTAWYAVVLPRRLERLACGLEDRCSIQLS